MSLDPRAPLGTTWSRRLVESTLVAPTSGDVPYRSEYHEELLERREVVRSELATLDARIEAFARVHRRERIERASPTILIVIVTGAVLMVLAVLFFIATLPRLGGSRIEQARTDAQSVRGAVEMFLAQNPSSGCPTVEQMVAERILSARTRTLDPWEGKFRIECGGGDVKVISAGPDHRFGTEDDVE